MLSSSDPPAYVQVAADLGRAIERGEYVVNAPLPTLTEIAATYGITKQTAREAIRALRMQGLVRVVHGRSGGTYVRDRTMILFPFNVYAQVSSGPPGRGGPWQTALDDQGLTGDMVVLQAVREPAADTVADALQRPRGSEVIRRSRHATLNSFPVQIQHAFYPYDLAQGNALEESGRIEGGILRLLNTLPHIERPVRIASLTLTTRRASSEEAAVFGLRDDPVTVVERVLVDKSGRPVELLHVVATDNTKFVIDLAR